MVVLTKKLEMQVLQTEEVQVLQFRKALEQRRQLEST